MKLSDCWNTVGSWVSTMVPTADESHATRPGKIKSTAVIIWILSRPPQPARQIFPIDLPLDTWS